MPELAQLSWSGCSLASLISSGMEVTWSFFDTARKLGMATTWVTGASSVLMS